jgi:hypothetical protein
VLELKSFREIEKETHVTYLRGGENLITIRGAGKATVTVSIGDLSLRANLEVLHAPVSLYMSRHELLKKYGFPLKKYQWRFGTLPAGFEELPRGCCGILRWTGFRDQGTNVEAWKLSDKRGEGLSRDDVTGEYWEYPQWPRCLILVGEQGVKSIVTLPAKTPVGTETASNAGKVQKPGGQESSASISALELWQEYGSNALAADAKYKNGQVVMSGGVHDIGRAKDGRYYVGFYVVVASAVDEFTYANMSARERKWWAEGYPPNVVCYLAKDAKEDFAGVQPGDKIRVRAKVVGMKQTDDVWQGYLVELENGQLIK